MKLDTDLPTLEWVDDTDVEMGKRITAAREARGISLQRLATHLNVSKATAGHWETGERSVKHHDLARLCVALGVSADQLLFGSTIWPFAGVDVSKVVQLEQADIQQLQGGLLLTAAQVGLDIAAAKGSKEAKASIRETKRLAA
jgi:transcriptional regulator with XRE-family HTH domain